ncbi:MAG: TRAP transporter substrate-binding protein DctP [Desulfarculaceae bacterium]|nr:TRAP transporter substrate-binding protein DctP [Desulfarculaceae bacterium]MCF8047862.1 TRAP transporter substrate-binding protein DctP [Desulfarculaceae bacterium]MCF8065411.1 TRAP transporter substrate-binding protein DctP [Desulfarculaceae bacterium]MCF8096746.1 TRAP transporter substrate-binding protein DctP [Desulfarculaceae bacterium]MCF8123318.1 TRAP transporter substrate-binding protein DctP [Desulfarculaceae bacterium]
MKLKKNLTVCALTLMLLISWAWGAMAATHKLTLAYLPVKGTTYVEYTEIFAKRVKEATKGQVDIILNDSLVKGTQLFQSVRDDRVQMATVLGGYYSATNPQIGLQQLPGLMDNLAEFKKVFYGFWRADMNKLFAKKYNVRVLWWGLFCPQNLISIKPINSLADFKGKKIRVHNIETATLVASIGAKPTPMPASEVLPALQRGIIDGVFTSSCWAYGQAFYTVAKYVSLWPVATILPFPVVINQQEWDKLPADMQKILTEVSQKTEQDAFINYQGIIDNFPKKWATKGVKYTVAPKDQVALMFQTKNIKPVYKSFFERAKKAGFDGKAYVEQAEKILGKDLKY